MPFRAEPIVLIVEDEAFIALAYADMVVDTGASVGGPFISVRAADKWLGANSPDFAILDIALLDGDSAQLAKKLCGREIPFIVISGCPKDSGAIDKIFESAPWLQKPLARGALRSALEMMLASEPNA